jgi:CheY-like chemotaxis protein
MVATLGVLAERMAVRPHTIVELVDRLVQRGLVTRQSVGRDRRCVRVALTSRAEWILRRLSEQHRCQLEISGPELMQAFSAMLPARTLPLPLPVPLTGEAPAVDASEIHVLCVDDEPRVLQGLRLNLESQFRVTTATSAAEALELCAADPPAVVLSDLRMPEMDGASLLTRVRDRAPHTVRILLTGQADVNAVATAVNEAGIFRFLTKPCQTAVLLSTLQAAGEQHRSLVGRGSTPAPL